MILVGFVVSSALLFVVGLIGFACRRRYEVEWVWSLFCTLGVIVFLVASGIATGIYGSAVGRASQLDIAHVNIENLTKQRELISARTLAIAESYLGKEVEVYKAAGKVDTSVLLFQRYPELKSNPLFLESVKALQGVESKLVEQVNNYNIKLAEYRAGDASIITNWLYAEPRWEPMRLK